MRAVEEKSRPVGAQLKETKKQSLDSVTHCFYSWFYSLLLYFIAARDFFVLEYEGFD